MVLKDLSANKIKTVVSNIDLVLIILITLTDHAKIYTTLLVPKKN